MENYRIVGTFGTQTVKNAQGQDVTRFVSIKEQPDKILSHRPLDITLDYASHQPINLYSRHSEYRGFVWGQITLSAGDIWPDWDGQRVIIEAGSHRVIYMKHGGDGSNHIYLQTPRDFITNVTTDTFNRKAYEKTKFAKRLAEWEIHFLTGFLGAAHWVGFVAVLSTDVLQQVIDERKRNQDYRDAAGDIVDVDQDLKQIAPVFRHKLLEVLIGGVKSNPGEKAKTFIQTLPEMIIKDDKTTGRIAGAIAAKFILNPKNNNLVFFFIFQTIAAQVATKSAAKIPPAVGVTLKDSFNNMMPDLDKLDPSNPADQQALANHLLKTMQELGVSVTPFEATQIMQEIDQNPERILANMQKLRKAFEKLVNAGNK